MLDRLADARTEDFARRVSMQNGMIGPMASSRHRDRVEGYIRTARDEDDAVRIANASEYR